MFTIIFACIHNAGRSQMAGAFFNTLCDKNLVRAISAGTNPAKQVHPEVITAMKEVGIDLSKQTPQKLTDELAKKATLLITMGCGEVCPTVPGLSIEDWPLADPKGQGIEQVREIRDVIKQKVLTLLQQKEWRNTTHSNIL